MAVDIGNSGVRVVCLPQNPQAALPEPLRINWRKDTDLTAQDLWLFSPEQIAWEEYLSPFIQGASTVEWWISSVQRAASGSLEAFLKSHSNCRVQNMDFRRLPLEVDVDYPERVGIDRLLAAYAACRLVDTRPLLVIQAGSAVTVDLVQGCYAPLDNGVKSRQLFGRFSGGAILPGVPMMLRLLGSAADMLPTVAAAEMIELPPLPGRNSQAAMLAGVSSCLVGGVQHLIRRYREAHGEPVPIVLSGGDGPLLKPHLTEPIVEVNHLVLQGLRLLTLD